MYNSFVIIISVFFSFQTYVWAQDSNDLGTYGDWQATFWNEGGGICTMMTIPKKSEGKYTKRGEVYAQVVKNMGTKDPKRKIEKLTIFFGLFFILIKKF